MAVGQTTYQPFLWMVPALVYIYIYVYIWQRLILRVTGQLGKADYLHNQKGSPKGVKKKEKGSRGDFVLLKCEDFLLWWPAALTN